MVREKKTGLLKAGSTVEVPDQFAVFNQEGNIDLQQTLISWLANDEQTAITGFTRKNRVEFFFPVKVIEATNGSKCPLGEEGCFNKEILIALHFLARKETKPNRPQFLTVVDAPFVVKDKNEDKGEDEKSNFCPSSQNNALAYLIGEETTALLASINVMTHLTQDAEDQGRKVLNFLKKTLKNLNKRLKKTCGSQMSSQFICSTIKNQIKKTPVSPMERHHIIAMMAHESRGECWAQGQGGSGLFQINPNPRAKSTIFSRCTKEERSKLHAIMNVNLNELKTGPQCLENPLVNLQESVRLLGEKRRHVLSVFKAIDTSPYLPPGETIDSFFKKNKKFHLQLILSAYNGGHQYLRHAIKAIDKYNKKIDSQNQKIDLQIASLHEEQSSLEEKASILSKLNSQKENLPPRRSPLKWEDLRTFYFSRAINPIIKDRAITRGRDLKKAIINVGYVEGLLGSSFGLPNIFEDEEMMPLFEQVCP